MAFPHPQARSHEQRNEYIPCRRGVLRNPLKRAIDVSDDRNAEDEVNRSKYHALRGTIHNPFPVLVMHGPLFALRSFYAELLRVLADQSLPSVEFHRVRTDDASDRLSRQNRVKDIH